MTLRLLLIRHAKSDWGDPGLPDHERPLNNRGRRDAPRMGRWIVEQGLAPAEVLCSDARRTRETLELMQPEWPSSPPASFRRELYHATPEAMLAVLEEARSDTVALVGHNPGIGALAARLARRAPDHPRWEDYPTASVAALAFEAESWFAISEGRGDVRAFAIPADLG
ncbi:SixA phosphatase family protein [Rubellimicrobium roseum]|uniref:Histidine phosphatase family protein n=1 Tax=Rubellimicrobium roseum TaxID=687525 RepID=A0A5C4N8C1_9RHOB|nr:histidine phosphatase family protein [Rubellimicrobium roseum]TNC65163.1 histidine phosphatase family protein [Rubellimicrobium roseum]